MTLQIQNNKQPDTRQAIEIYTKLGWGTLQDYELEKWQKAFDNSTFITAYDKDELVGFIRLLTDGFQDTQVLEFVVTPDRQRQGIGKSLINALKTTYGHTDIYCHTPNKNTDFFLHNGFKTNALTPLSYAAS